MRTRRLVLYKDAADDWRWKVIAGNGRIVADSFEGYEHREDCLRQALELFGTTVTYELTPEP